MRVNAMLENSGLGMSHSPADALSGVVSTGSLEVFGSKAETGDSVKGETGSPPTSLGPNR